MLTILSYFSHRENRRTLVIDSSTGRPDYAAPVTQASLKTTGPVPVEDSRR